MFNKKLKKEQSKIFVKAIVIYYKTRFSIQAFCKKISTYDCKVKLQSTYLDIGGKL